MTKSKKRNKVRAVDYFVNNDIKFCTKCQAELDNLAFEPENLDLEKAKARFNKCVDTGRFDGDLCARVFIAQENQFLTIWDEDDYTDL
jgi:hypothetical protein